MPPGTPAASFVPFPIEEVEQSIPARFARQVERHADRLAVKAGAETVTYAELGAATSGVASAVARSTGTDPEAVALLLEPGISAVAAMLGILKAGHICVPLDPALPPARLRHILDDVEARCLVTDGRRMPLARDVAPPSTGLLDADDARATATPAGPDAAWTPDRLAYVLYTSGSTGLPRGVMLSHRAVLHEVLRTTNGLRLKPDDRQTLLRSIAFVGAIRDILSALLNGASLHTFDLGEGGVGVLKGWLAEEEISVYRSVVSVFRRLLDTLSGTERFPHLRSIEVGGEPLTSTDVENFRRRLPNTCRLTHLLALTETGTARRFIIEADTPMPHPVVPVGYEVPDVEVLIVDDEGYPVPLGQPGEIAVRSRYLASGYWRRPDLTRERFLPDPDGGHRSVFLTGDLGRFLPDGLLLHEGRKDFQVKVRGQLVDLAEIERALLGVPGVRQAVAVVRSRDDDTRLVAYVVPVSTPGPTVSSLRRALGAMLPPAMIPRDFVVLDALPMTAGGKADRARLPAPGRARPALDEPYVPPRLPIEHAIAAIWAEVLGLDTVGVRDSLFDLGGHSLLATRIASRVMEVCDVVIPTGVLLEAPTVETMATLVAEQLMRRSEETELPPVIGDRIEG